MIFFLKSAIDLLKVQTEIWVKHQGNQFQGRSGPRKTIPCLK